MLQQCTNPLNVKPLTITYNCFKSLFPSSFVSLSKLKKEIMSTIKDKKWKRKQEQTNPTNPTGNRNIDTNKFDIDEKTIKDQQNKK